MHTNNVPAMPPAEVAAYMDQTAISQELTDTGYVPGFPGHATPATRRIDLLVASKLRCPCCGSRRMRGRPWHRDADRSYVMVAACANCQHGTLI